jgi:hypothetical protein
VLEKGVLRRTYRPKSEEVAGEWRNECLGSAEGREYLEFVSHYKTLKTEYAPRNTLLS